MTKLGALADIHLKPSRLDDQVAVLEQAFSLFVREGVDGVLIPGDIFDGPLVTPAEYVAFARSLEILGDIPVVATLGNGRHDLATRPVTALHVFQAMYAPERLTIRCEPGIVEIAGVAVVCVPWTTAVYRLAAMRPDATRAELNAEVADHLLTIADHLQSQVSGPSVLTGHWDVAGASLPNGLPVDVAHVPLLDAIALRDLGFDAVILGHVHRPQEFFPNGLYVGSPLCLDHGESGFEHGCWIVTVDGGTQAEFFALESREFFTIDVDELADDPVDWFERFVDPSCPPRGVEEDVVRVRFTATPEQARRIDTRAIIAALKDAGAHKVTVEPTVIRESVARVPGLSEDVDDYAAFDAWLAAEGIEGGRAALLKERHREYVDQVPA